MPTRSCPSCSAPLVQRSVASKYGATLVLDRCPSCRGIWLDRNELYQVSARGIEEFAADSPPSGDPLLDLLPSTARCPACGEGLTKLSGKSALAGIAHACYCNGCGGFWLGERDLVEFHRFREKRLASIGEEEKLRLAAQRKADQEAHPGEQADTQPRGGDVDGGAAMGIAGAALTAFAPPVVGPLVLVGLSLAERIAPFLADIVAQKLEAEKEDGRALPKSPKPRGGPRNRK